MRRKWRKIGRWALRLGGLALLGGIAAGWWWYDYPRVAADLPAAALAYRDAGLPWTAKDLDPNPPVKPEENAALLLRKATEAWPQRLIAAQEDSRVSYEDPLDEAIHYGEPIRPPLARVAKALEIAHRAAALPRLDIPIDWDLGWSSTPDERWVIGRIAKALAVRAELYALGGDDDRARADLEDARRVGVLAGQEPSLSFLSASAACDISSMRGAQACLAACGSDVKRLTRYQSWLSRSVPYPDARRTIRGIAYAMVAEVRNYEHEGIGTYWNPWTYSSGFDPGPEIDPARIRRDGFPEYQRPRAHLARTLRFWTNLADATNNFTDTLDTIPLRSAEIETSMISGLPTISQSWFAGPSLDVLTSIRSIQASRAVALGFADAMILHGKTGYWPTSCPVADPLGESSLHVRFDKGRFRIWSVGSNGKDENGLTGTELIRNRRSDDIVAAYPPVSRKVLSRNPGPLPKFLPGSPAD